VDVGPPVARQQVAGTLSDLRISAKGARR
jgi:hypothetical protein